MTHILLDMPSREYHALDRLSQTGIKAMLRSPAHFKAWHDAAATFVPTPQMQFGTVLHALLLEPEKIGEVAVVLPDDTPDKRTKEGKVWWSAFGSANAGKIILTTDEWKRAEATCISALAHPEVAAILDASDREVTMLWDEQNVLCKARADLREGLGAYIADVKTAIDASRDGFQKALWNFRYDLQGAFYTRASRETTSVEPRAFIIIAVETFPPFACAVYQIAPRAIVAAQNDIEHALKLYEKCKREDEWPAYGGGISVLDLPPWAQKRQTPEEF